MSIALAVKLLVWSAAALAATFRPTLAETFFHKLEITARSVARHTSLIWLAAGLLVLLVRGMLLPLWPIPKPVIYDEFSYILQADTFAHGRLTNPTHPLWPFFESPYVLQHPTYASKYPPAQSLAMAAGEAVFGDPWFGVWLSCGAMAAALVWALQGWLPPGWAMLGGFLALPLAIDSYWMNSYWGGAVAALGGALVLGGTARVLKRKHVWYGLAIGLGLAILANSRPYEGLVLALAVAIALLLPRPHWGALAWIAVALIPAGAATAHYNRTVTGSALQLPFTEYAAQYARIPLFNFLPLQAAKTYSNPVLEDLHQNWEPEEWRKSRTRQLLSLRLLDWRNVASVVLGSWVMGLLGLAFFRNLWRDRRIRLPLVCVLAALAGSFLEVRYYQHYAGAATAALFVVTLQALRHLRQWKPAGRPLGLFLSRALPAIVVGVSLATQATVILRQEPPENSQPPNAHRDELASLLVDPAGSVILVHYTGSQSPHAEWVYNSANIDAQDVIWAHDLGSLENARLVEYYKHRKIWRFEPDIDPTRLEPYR